MKTTIFFLLFFTLYLTSPLVQGCTTFLLKDAKGNLYFGRNYDFPVGEGLIQINERNVLKQAMVMPSDNPYSWVSLYGSITFNQVGKEFPYGGSTAPVAYAFATLDSVKQGGHTRWSR